MRRAPPEACAFLDEHRARMSPKVADEMTEDIVAEPHHILFAKHGLAERGLS